MPVPPESSSKEISRSSTSSGNWSRPPPPRRNGSESPTASSPLRMVSLPRSASKRNTPLSNKGRPMIPSTPSVRAGESPTRNSTARKTTGEPRRGRLPACCRQSVSAVAVGRLRQTPWASDVPDAACSETSSPARRAASGVRTQKAAPVSRTNVKRSPLIRPLTVDQPRSSTNRTVAGRPSTAGAVVGPSLRDRGRASRRRRPGGGVAAGGKERRRREQRGGEFR